MKDATRDAIRIHVAKESPREACGLILNASGHERYWPCRNVAENNGYFIMSPEDYCAAEDSADIVAIVHSHPYGSGEPSEHDRVGCERSGVPWVIVGWPNGDFVEIKPEGYRQPLLGREFVYGVSDCYTLMQDWYAQRSDLEIDGRPLQAWRADWYKGPHAEDLYMEGFEAEGWERVTDLKRGDAILVQLLSNVANHVAIYLGDNVILHHPQDRLSCREVFDGYWRKHAVAFWRYPNYNEAEPYAEVS